MQPLVSVRVVAFNHERYAAKCLEGVLMQRTSFPFEVIVGEDCSSDGTRKIVESYATQYPQHITMITSDANVGGTRNILRVNNACRGKYLAYCEADDYWIDPLKLQKQVDFMEAHPETPMCFHDSILVHEGKSGLPRFVMPAGLPPAVTIGHFLVDGCWLHYASTLVRKWVLDSLPEWRSRVWCGDLLSVLWCAHHGPLGYLDEAMSVYLRHSGGLTQTTRSDPDQRLAGMEILYRELDRETGFRYTEMIAVATRRARREHRYLKLRARLGRLAIVLFPVTALKKLSGYVPDIRARL